MAEQLTNAGLQQWLNQHGGERGHQSSAREVDNPSADAREKALNPLKRRGCR